MAGRRLVLQGPPIKMGICGWRRQAWWFYTPSPGPGLMGGRYEAHLSSSSPTLQWLKDPGPRTEKRTLCCDMVCFLFITPLAAISGWLCLRGAQDHLRLHSRLEAVGLIALTIALFTIYVLWTLVSGCQLEASGGLWFRAGRPGVWAKAWGPPCLPLPLPGWKQFSASHGAPDSEPNQGPGKLSVRCEPWLPGYEGTCWRS